MVEALVLLTYNINILFNHNRQWRNEESAILQM